MNVSLPLALLVIVASALSACDSDESSESSDSSTQAEAGAESTGAPAWSTHVKPIIAERCGACHVEGGAAPFALDSYEALNMYGDLALDSMESGRMPPWQAADDCNPLQHERSIPAEELELFKAWWGGERQRGPELAEESESPAMSPSMSVGFDPTHRARVPAPYTPKVGESDDYRCFILDIELDETMYLVGSDVAPGNSLVHHVLVYALTGDQAEEARELDEAEAGPGYTCFGGPIPLVAPGAVGGVGSGGGPSLGAALSSLSFPNQIGSWVPGSSPALFEPGTALRIDAGSQIVMQVHYSTISGEELSDERTEYQAILTAEPPETLIKSRPFAQRELDIPAGESEVTTSITIPYYSDSPSVLVGMAGHMHLLGESIKAEVERADGSRQCGLDIPKWDFQWQEAYDFERGHELTLESGDRLKLTCVYDNSSANQPVVNGAQLEPRDVAWGDGTLDEMCLLYTRSREPFAELTQSEAPCSSACVDDCQGDLACLTRCENDDLRCTGCVMEKTLSCEGANQCLGGLLSARECLRTCVSSAIMLGGNFGLCAEAECAEAWSATMTCLSERIASEPCGAELTACGL